MIIVCCRFRWQLFLRADIGIDFVDFFNLLHVIADRRLSILYDSPDIAKLLTAADTDAGGELASRDITKTLISADIIRQYLNSDSTKNQALYDIFRISKIVAHMTEHLQTVEILELGRRRLVGDPDDLRKRLLFALELFLANS